MPAPPFAFAFLFVTPVRESAFPAQAPKARRHSHGGYGDVRQSGRSVAHSKCKLGLVMSAATTTVAFGWRVYTAWV